MVASIGKGSVGVKALQEPLCTSSIAGKDLLCSVMLEASIKGDGVNDDVRHDNSCVVELKIWEEVVVCG